jgi:DNA-binding NarL/FixJ family response regulator
MLSVLIVSETRLYREGLAELLTRGGLLQVITTAARADEGLQKACELHPRVVILDLAGPDGLLLSRSLAQVRPGIRRRSRGPGR